MTAKNKTNNTALSLVIQHAFDTTLDKGIYKVIPGYYKFIPSGNYVISDSIFYGSGIGANSDIEITVSDINASTIKGNFNGKFFKTDDTSNFINIINGSFYLPVQ